MRRHNFKPSYFTPDAQIEEEQENVEEIENTHAYPLNNRKKSTSASSSSSQSSVPKESPRAAVFKKQPPPQQQTQIKKFSYDSLDEDMPMARQPTKQQAAAPASYPKTQMTQQTSQQTKQKKKIPIENEEESDTELVPPTAEYVIPEDAYEEITDLVKCSTCGRKYVLNLKG